MMQQSVGGGGGGGGMERVSHKNLPTEDPQDEVQHEEGSDDNERNKVDPIKEAPQGVVSL